MFELPASRRNWTLELAHATSLSGMGQRPISRPWPTFAGPNPGERKNEIKESPGGPKSAASCALAQEDAFLGVS